jgi:hypothetical protein
VAVDDVFLLPVPESNAAHPQQIAVINLDGSFVDHHPSGILVENLTLLSILGTLHANFPQIAQVRFLVDGHSRETLAGHADLSRTYLTANDVPGADGSDAADSQDAKPAAKQPAESRP